jgi:hypothetical protein
MNGPGRPDTIGVALNNGSGGWFRGLDIHAESEYPESGGRKKIYRVIVA